MSPAANRSRQVATPALMRSLLVVGFLLATGAIVIAVFSDDIRLLKLAALVGVWAALATAFPVVYFRRTARAAEQKTEESKRTYELELRREISARREYEIGVSAAAVEQAETRHSAELAGLREQLDRLNSTLSGLLDGDLLFQRLTLSAESTRVRQVGSETVRSRLGAMARPGQIEGIPEGTGPYIGQQSEAPVSVGPSAGSASGPSGPAYSGREDDTVQFPRATFGPYPEPAVVVSVDPAVAEAPVTAVEQDDPSAAESAEVGPEADAEPEVAVESGLEPVVEAAAESTSSASIVAQEDAPPEPSNAGTGRSAGISVADLVAALGAGEGTHRRRRRAED